MNHYELLYLISGAYTDDELPAIKEKVKATVVKNGGKISFEDSLGKRKLAYPVQKVRHGYYLLAEFDLEPEALKKLNTDLRLTTEVLRHMIVTKDLRASRFRSVRMPRTESRIETKTDHPKEGSLLKTHVETEPTREKVSLEDLDKKLDEILEGDIL